MNLMQRKKILLQSFMHLQQMEIYFIGKYNKELIKDNLFNFNLIKFRSSSHSDSLLCREISAKIRRAFTDLTQFDAQLTVLITWENVQNVEQNATNTYQVNNNLFL